MTEIRNIRTFMRVSHRYLGYFLAGIMAFYAISGVLLIYRDTDFLKTQKTVVKTVDKNLTSTELENTLKINKLKVQGKKGAILYFNRKGEYNAVTGDVTYRTKELPYILEKMVQLHKSKSGNSLSPLNTFFGASLLFFVISSFWMFNVKCKAFKRGMWVAAIGLVLAFLLIFLY